MKTFRVFHVGMLEDRYEGWYYEEVPPQAKGPFPSGEEAGKAARAELIAAAETDRGKAYAAFLRALDGYFMPDRCSMEKLKARDEIYFAAMNLATASEQEMAADIKADADREIAAIEKHYSQGGINGHDR